MNRFRVNLHPVVSGIETTGNVPEGEKTALIQRTQEELRRVQESVIDPRRNNEALASSTEKKDPKEDIETQLKQLAKNKKIDFPWTDNAWKCSRAERRLATSSAKVFQQLLDAQTLTQMIEKCKSKNGELTDQDAESRKSELGINSKTKDIQNFYKAYLEYQNPQSSFQHLKNLMGFFCENDFSNIEGVRKALEIRSEKISKQDINNAGKMLYQEGWVRDADGNERYVIIDNKTGEEIDRKPKDWEKRASFLVIKDRLKDGDLSTDKMLTLLGDFNLDGEVNTGDVGYKTGGQVVDVFRRTIATKQLEDPKFSDDIAVKNLVDYANKFGMGIPLDNDDGQPGTLVKGLYNWMTDDKNGYENTIKFQDFLRNLPIELTDVLSNGVNAGAQSLENMTGALQLEELERKNAEKAAQEKAEQIIADGEAKVKEVIKDDNERANIMQQLLTQLPAMLISRAMGEKKGISTGVGLPLDEIIKGASATFSIGIDGNGKPKFGLFVGWDRKFKISNTADLRTAVSGGAKLAFIPFAASSIELGIDTNKHSRDQSLDAQGEHGITLGGNVAITGGIFSYGFSAGYENNKQKGIEKQAENINKVMKNQAKGRIESLKGSENKELSLLSILEKEFPKSSEEELKKATTNLLSIIQGFKIDEKTTSQDFDTYAQIVADVYAEQWRNAALAGVADNKRKISGGRVGIQFIAGCMPAITLVARFTKYRNARTNETEHSQAARIDAQVNGTGNVLVNLEGKEIGNNQVSQFNEILKRYGAKSQLSYSTGVDGKPGKFTVPASIADGIGINVRVSQSMKGCVQRAAEKHAGGETFYQFPANATYRLLQETGGNQRSVTLNIGSDKNDASDIMISNAEGMKTLFGDKELMGGKKWQDKEAVISGFDTTAEHLNILTNLETVLRDVDTDNRKAFSAFTKNKNVARENFGEVVKAFTDAINSSTKIDATTKANLLNEFNNLGDIDKQLIIDRVISIAAYYEDVHNEVGLNKRIDARIKRGDKYKILKGPNGQPIFSEFGRDYRSDVVAALKDGGSYQSVSTPNILGATAFYNKKLDDDARGIGTTGLGTTTVLGGKSITLGESDASKAKEWFLGEHGILKKEPEELNNLKNIIKEKLPDRAKDKLGLDNLKKLLSGENIEIKLDNSEKKVKVNMNVDYVFYLMGECGNESVGMQLGNISVIENEEVDDYRDGKLYVNNGDGSSSVGVDRKDVAFGVSFGGQKKNNNTEENTPVGSDRADDGGKKFHTDDGENPDPDNNPPEVNDDPTKTDTGGEEV